MPSIQIKNDQLTLDLITAEAGPGSGIGKYFKGDTAAFIAVQELSAALNKSIATITPGPLGLSLNFAQDGAFGTSGVEWKLQASARAAVDVTQAGNALPGDSVFAHPAQIENGFTCVGISFTPTLSAGISGSAGDLQFGFEAGRTVEFRSARMFPVSSAPPTLGDALKDLLVTSVVPGDVEDLRRMQPGDVASVRGSGNLTFSAKFNVAQALNPLATPTLGLEAIGALSLQPKASLDIGATVGVSGSYQIRVQKMTADIVRLGLYKLAGTQFNLDVKASAGLNASLGKRDLTGKLMSFLGGTPTDTVELVDAGLSDQQIQTMKDAIEASLSRSLAVSLSGSFAASSTDTTVFEYEFDLSQLNAESSEAIHRALDADFSALTSKESGSLPAGVRLIVSEAERVRQKSVTWRVNLLGIVNVLKVSKLVITGKVMFDAETGELVITDSATASKILAITDALKKPDRLRTFLMQSAILTAAWRATTSADPSLTLSGAASYFDRKANATRQNISDYLDNLVGLTLMDAARKQSFIDSFIAGHASILCEAQFYQESVEAMFLASDASALPQSHFDQIGRECILALIQPGDPDDFRRKPMQDDGLWREMTDKGQFNFRFIAALPQGPALEMIIHDYTVIRWWSNAMSEAAKQVQKVKRFLSETHLPPEQLKDNKDFQKLRRNLHDSLADVVGKSTPDFLDAWGVLAMVKAANSKAAVRGILLTDGPVLAEERPMQMTAGR